MMDLNYVAALVDSEGCLTFGFYYRDHGGTQVFYPIAMVTNGRYDVLVELRQFGGNVYRRKPVANRKPAWDWRMQAQPVYPFLDLIKPYLRMKRAQADILLNANMENIDWSVAQIRQLNRRGC